MLLIVFFSHGVYAQCDQLFSEPEFGVENIWKASSKGYEQDVNFRQACLKRSDCYLKKDSVRSQCDDEYLKRLKESCEQKLFLDSRLLGQCEKKINKAFKLVQLEGGQYFRAQQRKADSEKREAARKLREEKRKNNFAKRSEERRKKRMGR